MCGHVNRNKSNISFIVAVNFCFTSKRVLSRVFIFEAEVSIVSIFIDLL